VGRRTRRRETYSRRRRELRERPDLAAPDWPPPEPDDRDPAASWDPETDPAPVDPIDAYYAGEQDPEGWSP
jgi:hypothetical protein